MQKIEVGLWQHYKGDYYWVLGTTQIDNEGDFLVVYQDAAGQLRARFLDEFTEKVKTDTQGIQLRYKKVDSKEHPPEVRRYA